jgi:microsomal dipeptidase-like Zn-dependent dipeptidase
MDKPLSIDLHCHPSIKPFGMAQSLNNENCRNVTNRNSIWYHDPPSAWDKFLNWTFLGITGFRQSDFTALHKGNVRVAVCALNPVEKGFFTSRPGSSHVADFLYKTATGIGRDKIDFIQANTDNFSEFMREYDFYRQLDGKDVTVDGNRLCYKLAKNYSDIETNFHDPNVISVVLSIEGAYVFNRFNNRRPEDFEIIPNIKAVKKWKHVPFFITLSHHFYNEIGGHSGSLHNFIKKALDQSYGLNTGCTKLGKKVIRELLDTGNGKRILIDIKHMSRRLRLDYYDMLDREFEGEDIPVFASHGALNGYESINDSVCPNLDENGLFFGGDVNFYDDEILRIEKSHGVFGLQLDDRLISSKKIKHKVFVFYSKKRKLRIRSKKIWNHIQRIAELLDKHGRNAWGTVALGTDFDGMVDPPNGFWTAKEFPLLYQYLLIHARNYLNNGNNPLQVRNNKNILPEDAVDNIFSGNALRFLKDYYK